MSNQNAAILIPSRTAMVRAAGLLLCSAFFAICISCSNSSSNTTPPPASFTLLASPTSLSVQRTGQSTVAINVVPANGFSGSVDLTITGLPNGVTGTFSPTSTSTSCTLTLTAASSATLGSVTLTITGTANSLTATTTINLTVVAGGFTLSAASTSLPLAQGSQGTDTITVVPSGGFNGTVALSASGLPSGISASFNPASATSSSTLTLTASSTATTGTAVITVKGTSNGLSTTVNINLTVGGFSLSVSPAALTIEQGKTGTAIVTVTETNFSNPVALSTSGVPSGVTASFNPASTSTQSTLTFPVSATATAATSTITISGKSGSVTQTTALTLTVTASTSSGGLPASFFALSNVDPTDNPTTDGMSYGAVGHPDRLAWPYIEPTEGTFDFSLYDQYVAIAPREGPGGVVAVMDLTLGMTPQWATSDATTCRTLTGGVIGCQAPPPPGQPYWHDFITALAQHYDGSSPSRPQIKYYEIWNEWNLQDPSKGYWMGTIPDLVALQVEACSIIHAIDQYSKVLTPSTVGPAQTWTDKAPQDLFTYLSDGGSNCLGGPNNSVDGVSFHGIIADPTVITSNYPLPGVGCTGTGCNGAIQTMIDSYEQILQQSFVPGTLPPLFDTEGSFETANITDLDQRAAWLAQFYSLQASLSTTDDVQWVSWFTWGYAASPGVPGQIETSSHQPDTAGVAYNQIFNWLSGKSPAQCSQSGSIWTCPLTGSSNYKAQIMWDDSQTCSNGSCTTTQQPAPSGATQWRDLAGTTHQITSSQVPVGLKPIIVEN